MAIEVGLNLAAILLSVSLLLLASACAWLGLRLAEQNGRILLRLATLEGGSAPPPPNVGTQFGVPAGTILSDFSLPVLSGGSMTLSQWRCRMVGLILFDPNCLHCRRMLPDLGAAVANMQAGVPQPLILSTGAAEASHRLFDKHPVPCAVLLQKHSEAAGLAGAGATPVALPIDEQGRTARNAWVGSDEILARFRAAALAINFLQCWNKSTANGLWRLSS